MERAYLPVFSALLLGALSAPSCTGAPPAADGGGRHVEIPDDAGVAGKGGTPDPGAPGSGDPGAFAGDSAAPVTGHPRLWIRAEDLGRLRSWATSQNPMYAKGLAPALKQALDAYDNKFYPNGQPNPTWPDPGSDDWVDDTTEAYAEFFAFLSLVDPDPSARAAHAERARNLLMHVMNEAAKGADSGSNPGPFRSRAFATANRANYWGEAFGLTVDWIYPSLSAEDKSTIRKVFLRWADACVHASTTADEHPHPVGATDDPALLSDLRQLRWAANNYFAGHMRQLTLMSLALDPEDDPPRDPAAPPTQLGNTLRSYLHDVTGAWLYQQYAMYEDPALASAALGVPRDGLGLASGGLPVEGSLYGESLGFLHEALFALHTAGYDSPTVAGPQGRLAHSAFWDRMLAGYLHSLAPESHPPADASFHYLGPLFQMMSYGDILRFWATPEMVTPLGSLGAMDQAIGRTDRLPALRWIAKNALEGGPDKLYERASRIWGNSNATQAILYYLLFDPGAPEPADPRPGMPTTFVDPGIGRVLARTDWSPDATWFGYLCSWETINHQLGDCNQIELYRKGEWLFKERSGYSNDFVAATSDYHDTLSIQNDRPSHLDWFEGATADRGGQWTNGANAGDPTVVTDAGHGFVYAYGDATNLYNRPGRGDGADGALDVVHASRSVVWLQPDHVVVYDRATTKKANRFKRFNLTVIAKPSISGRQAVVTTPGGQQLTVQSLLPANAAISTQAAESFSRVADLEPTRYRLVVEDPARPADVRFLHVLQGTDANVAADPAALVTATGGTPFQGAVVHGTAVLFPVDPGAPFAGTRYVVPAATATHLITGLAPGAGYTVSITPAGGGKVEVDVRAGGDQAADAGGVLVVSPAH